MCDGRKGRGKNMWMDKGRIFVNFPDDSMFTFMSCLILSLPQLTLLCSSTLTMMWKVHISLEINFVCRDRDSFLRETKGAGGRRIYIVLRWCKLMIYLMNKDIGSTIEWSNESPSFCNIEPFTFPSSFLSAFDCCTSRRSVRSGVTCYRFSCKVKKQKSTR